MRYFDENMLLKTFFMYAGRNELFAFCDIVSLDFLIFILIFHYYYYRHHHYTNSCMYVYVICMSACICVFLFFLFWCHSMTNKDYYILECNTCILRIQYIRRMPLIKPCFIAIG